MMKNPKILLLRIFFALISYLLIIFGAQPSKAQSPFTKEHWEQLPSDFSMGMELESGIGVGPGTDSRGRFRR
jgi:hypothetical protein